MDEDKPTEITIEDLDKAMGILMKGPRKCSCENGFPAQYEVNTPGYVYDLMCIQCFKELTKHSHVIQIGM